MDKLREWADQNSKEYEVIAQKRDSDAPVADRALEIVRQFIIERKLILYGGQAIDFALRLKGSQIYPEHQTPDYDFFSPQSVDDAYDLADRLVAAGFENVKAIPAIHVQTMRVATDFIFVADISYAPPEVYESFPTVSYAGMRILHPNYQRTDMHLAFCFPFNSPPREDIFHRYKKDLKRFQLFQKFYPIENADALVVQAEGGAGDSAKKVEVDPARVAIHGFAGYALIRRACEELIGAAEDAKLAEAVSSARKLFDGTPDLAIEITQAKSAGRAEIHFAPPKSSRLTLATPWPDEVVADLTRGGAEAEWYAPYMDSRPLMARTPSADVYSTRNRLLAVSKIQAGGRQGEITVTVASAQYILLNFLYEAHAGDDSALYVAYYKALLDLLEAGGTLIAALRGEGSGPEVSAETYRAFVESSPFGLPVSTLGDVNHDSSYLIRLANSARQVGDEPPGIDLADLPDPANVPARYFPGGKHTVGEHPRFEYDTNSAFQRAGKRLPSIIEGGSEEDTSNTSGTTMAAKKPTFLVLTTQLDGDVLEEVLSTAGWRDISVREAQRNGVDCFVVGGQYNSDRRLWKIRAGVKSRLQIPMLTNKALLHETLIADPARRDFVCETHIVPAESASPPKIPGPGVWIWRPGDGWSGKGIYVFSTQDELDKIWRQYAAAPRAPALISKYIENPLLIDIDGEGHKMHLRLYFLVAVIPKGVEAPEGRRAALISEGVIINAIKPYEAADFQNKDIHDTHADGSRGNRFPHDYPGGPDKAAAMFDKAAEMMGSVAELALPTAAPYGESKGGFEILAVDFMVDEGDRLWLIEINDRVGFDGLPEASDGTDLRSRRSRFIFQSVAEFVLGVESDGAEELYQEVASANQEVASANQEVASA